MENHVKTRSFNPVGITAAVQYTDKFTMATEWRVNLFGVIGTGPNFLDAMSDLQNRLAIQKQAIFKLDNKVYDKEETLGTKEEDTEELNEEVDRLNLGN